MQGMDETGAGGPCRIAEPYLLALNVCLRRHEGGYWTEPAWVKDVDKHLAYLPDLTIFCPVERRVPDPGWARIERPGLRIVSFRQPRSLPTFLLASPVVVARLAREVARARIVHSGVGGWPLPLGWAATPLARMMGKTLVLIVESSFWRVPAGATAGPLRRLQAWIWEGAARACMARADYAGYTQPDYRRSLPGLRAGGGTIVQASWVDAADCLTDDAAGQRWAAKRAAAPRFLFAARLLEAKGTGILADALALLAARDAEVAIDVIGEGPERERLAAAADTPWGRRHVRLLDPIPYDARFLAFVGTYHALLVPGLSDEQPRIVYDGYSQAVPAIGSDLGGLRACIDDEATGRLFPAGDAPALAAAIVEAAGAPETLLAWGTAGLAKVRTLTHDRLHADRCRALRALLDRDRAVAPA